MKPQKIQFAFYTKGYGEDGKVKALVLIGRKKIICDQVFCLRSSWTVKRKRNPVFVVETVGYAYKVENSIYIYRHPHSLTSAEDNSL